LDNKGEGDNIIAISGIEFLVDPKSEELLKRYGGAILDYNEKKFYGSGFSLKLKDVADC
jgi:Fe-S cluster assembly iron-binding protein IscA